jgi:hypothetical protein
MNSKPETLKVDEVEMAERSFLLELISTILQLSYTSLCKEAVWKLVNSTCEGCELNLPSQKDHQCAIIHEEEAFNLFYDEAIQTVDSNRIWDLAQSVCQMLEFNIHPSWFIYISELYKLPWTTIYLSLLQFECCSDRFGPPLRQIIQVLTQGPLRINRKRKTISKACKISCPDEFRRKEEERMDIDR